MVLSPTGNLEEAAQKLFAALRTLDALPIALILAAFVPDTGIGRAINDRLKKAATRWGELLMELLQATNHADALRAGLQL